ncbi:MAG: hypothetical protein H0T79_06525 [Deltaproteobacteria bacterium]|nr:hypothetical protein [Deltaproteobacteria bacterium]
MTARLTILATSILNLSVGLGLVGMGTVGCSDDDDVSVEPLGGSLTVTGQVVDFQSGAAIESGTSVATSGLVPSPLVTTLGSTFTIEHIPENSAFQILASAVPTHRATFSSSVIVTTSDVADVKAPAVSEAFLATLSSGFGVSPTAAKGVLFIRLVDGAGAPRAGVAGSNLIIAGAVGPKFLDANMMPDPAATASSTSGWAVFFEVAPGVASFAPAVNATVTLDMAVSPINAGAVTLVQAKVTDGAQVLPTNVLFATQVFPIFSNRGCVACHSGGGIGKDLGGLMLDGGANNAYKELVIESTTRVRIATPETSTVLTLPSREDPPDRHPNVTFTGPNDPDYLKILVWIREGAKDN